MMQYISTGRKPQATHVMQCPTKRWSTKIAHVWLTYRTKCYLNGF